MYGLLARGCEIAGRRTAPLPGARRSPRASSCSRRVPPLPAGARCGLVQEAVTDDGRLTLATVKAAVRAGTVAANHVRVTALSKHRGKVSGALLKGREGSFAGLRVLRPGHEPAFDASREHLLSVGPAGMVSVAGGKLTTHRPIALDALRALPSEVRPRRLHPCLDPLPGASPPDERALRSTLDAATARHLAELYGGEAGDLLGYAASFPEALERVHPAGPDLWAQIHHAADEEWAVTAEDVTRRRTTLAVRGLDAYSVREGIAAILAEGRLRSVISGPKSSTRLDLLNWAVAPPVTSAR